MATVITGVVSDNTIVANQRIIDMSERISLLEPDVAPLTTFLMKLRSKDAHSQKVEWLSDELMPRLTGLAASAASADSTMGVTAGTGQYWRVGDTMRIATTGENVAVTAVSTDTLGVTRAIGSVAAATAASGVDVVLVGNASAEGATIGTLKQTKLVANYNYTQIQRNPYGTTETLANSDLYGGPDMKRERMKKMIEHKASIEHTLFWGRRQLTTSGAQPIAWAGGLSDFITTNITTAASNALTLSAFETFLRSAYRYGSHNKVLFCSPLIASGISNFAASRMAPPQATVSAWGTKLNRYVSGAYGDGLDVVVMREWQDYQAGSNQFGGWAFLIDMDDLRFRPLQNRNTKVLRDRQAPDEDSQKEEVLTEWTLEIGNEKNHAVLKGVTAFS